MTLLRLTKGALRRFTYRIGLFTAVHRLRNRRTLTVIGLHRVLPRHDIEYSRAMPEYTLTSDQLRTILTFVRTHYSVVSLEDLLASYAGERLPDFAALITFDDGWKDHATVALPILKALSLPAIVFIATDHIGSPHGFWETRVYGSFRTMDAATRLHWWSLGGMDGAPPSDPDLAAFQFLTYLEHAPDDTRASIIPNLLQLCDEEPEWGMCQIPHLAELIRGGVNIGAHGHSHQRLTKVADCYEEMIRSKAVLRESIRLEARAMSFPHGAYNADVVRDALAAGFQVCFTSDCVLNQRADGSPSSRILGRVFLPAPGLTDSTDRIQPDLLANALFRPRIAAISAAEE